MNNLKLYKRMLGYMRPYAALIAAALLLALLAVAFEGLSLWFSASLVQTIFDPEALKAEKPEYTLSNANAVLKYWTSLFIINSKGPVASLQIVCVLMSLSFLLKNIFLYLKNISMTRLNLSIVRDMRNQLFTHSLALPVSYYDRTKSGNVISLVMNDITSINNSMTSTFDKIIVEPLRLAAFVAMLFIINYKFTLAIFIIFPVLGLLITLIGRTVRRRSKRVMEYMASLLSILHETVNGIRIVKIFGTLGAESKKFKSANQLFARQSFRSSYVGALASPVTEVMGVVVVVILLWYGGNQVLNSGGFGADDFTRFLIFLFSVFTPLKEISKLNTTLQTGFASADRVFGALDSAVEELGGGAAINVNSNDNVNNNDTAVLFNDKISFHNVHFNYPGCADAVLKNISFEIKKGSVSALVGSSGSGKTTTLDLLPRFYDITGGKICIDGVDTRSLRLPSLRKLFGTVSQEVFLFNDSISANIAYGMQSAGIGAIISAAKAANAWEFIEKLPSGLDTVIGERGVMLSGGQRQRLSIARALLLNPPILILDEATSSLDTESERLVQAAINNVMENRTVLVVAHRLSTIRNADQILVLEAGEIAERGTHDELLAKNCRYKYFYDIQFAVAGK
ncbi:MAG: ATP-binding cassette domain-containing protein [Chitinispirillales bacterium]|jgi:subfamily B ATP-binding cassette protein MsbA|nr:ATP-binding cassette domain-containing protein [Chitinispirillales bacterium]